MHNPYKRSEIKWSDKIVAEGRICRIENNLLGLLNIKALDIPDVPLEIGNDKNDKRWDDK